jgi:ribonuclease R
MSKKASRDNPGWQKMSKGNASADHHDDGPVHVDLRARAHAEMLANGFVPDFEPDVIHEVNSVIEQNLNTPNPAVKDMRALLWSSIDNVESKDLDQIEYAERLADGSIRVIVGIADVDSFVQKGSATDQHAFKNTTSVYTGVVTYPMLPDALSFDATSLLQDVDRLAIVIDLTVDKTGAVVKSDIYPALTNNKAKLDYQMVGNWLEAGGPAPERISSVPQLADQLLLQNEAKERIKDLRDQQGSLHLENNEAATVAKDGQVIALELVQDNPARDLIENFMIAANIAVSHYLEDKGLASLRRVVKTPEKWERIVEVARTLGENLPEEPDVKSLAAFLLKRKAADPDHFPDLSLTIVKLLGRGVYTVEVPGQADEGHFSLAVHDYTHATAPNRRYPDLVTQRLIKSVIAKKETPYTVDELNAVAEQCTEREEASNKVERTMRKVAAAVLLGKHIGETFDAFVTGVKADATYVRLLKPPAEGRVLKGQEGLNVGDKIRVRLLSTDPEHAYIDFARA